MVISNHRFLPILFISSLLIFGKDVQMPDPRATVEAFCKAEFTGNEDAYSMIILSKRRQAEFAKSFPGEQIGIGNMISGPYDCVPITLVTFCRIIDVSVKGKTAIANVEYQTVAELKRSDERQCTDQVVLTDKKTKCEKLVLRYSNGVNGMKWVRGTAWYVEDPPLPKISVETMRKLCEKKLRNFSSIAANEQKNGRPIPSNISFSIAVFEKKVRSIQALSDQPDKP